MIFRKIFTKNSFILFLTLLFVYIVLFEFILPINKILPKPFIVVESVVHILNDYNLFTSLVITVTTIYLSMIVSYLILFFFSEWFFYLFINLGQTIKSFRLFRYVTIISLVVLFNYWFAEKLFGEYYFSILAALLLASKKMNDESSNTKKEYLDVANNLNLNSKKIFKDIYWKSVQPVLTKYYEKIHQSLWSYILLYEFIGDYAGLGFAYRNALMYKDYTAILIFTIFISVLIWIGNIIIRLLRKNLIHWND